MSDGKRQIWGSHLEQAPDAVMVAFCAGRDVTPLPMADEVLLPFDVWTNRAHAIMLHRQGVLDGDALRALLAGLDALEGEWEAGTFRLDPALEDVHVNVERYLTARAGEQAGGRLHTGRSRNDQVACDMRLFLREALLGLGASLEALGRTLLEQARRHAGTVMPGFTHHQPAMVTTWGHWLCGYVQALGRDLERVRHAHALVNRNPLGAAAGFGTSWPIDRAMTAELLGFAATDGNTLDCIGARWEHEAQAAFTYAAVMNHLSVQAQDLILLTHPYWGMLSLPDAYVTGSSIMPQKRNPDFAEVVKGKAAWVHGMLAGLLGVPRGNMSGYNRDTQQTKYAVIDVVRECQPAPAVLRGAFQALRVHEDVMRERLQLGFLAAADFADALARHLNLPFRAAYDITATAVRHAGAAGHITPGAAREALQEAGHDPAAAGAVLDALEDPARIVALRDHEGAPAPERVREQAERLERDLDAAAAWLQEQRRAVTDAAARCRSEAATGAGR